MELINIANHRVIDAAKKDIFEAIIAEVSGHTTWSRPYLYFKSETPAKAIAVGDKKWLYISKMGFPKMCMSILEINAPYELKVKYVDGDFVGLGYFVLNDYQDKVKVSFLWHTTTNSRLFKIMSILFPVKYVHWLVVNWVLLKLERYIKRQSTL